MRQKEEFRPEYLVGLAVTSIYCVLYALDKPIWLQVLMHLIMLSLIAIRLQDLYKEYKYTDFDAIYARNTTLGRVGNKWNDRISISTCAIVLATLIYVQAWPLVVLYVIAVVADRYQYYRTIPQE